MLGAGSLKIEVLMGDAVALVGAGPMVNAGPEDSVGGEGFWLNGEGCGFSAGGCVKGL